MEETRFLDIPKIHRYIEARNKYRLAIKRGDLTEQSHQLFAQAFVIGMGDEKAREFFSWAELCEGIEAVFYWGDLKDIVLVLDHMKEYASKEGRLTCREP
jgi:hypothetical protein